MISARHTVCGESMSHLTTSAPPELPYHQTSQQAPDFYDLSRFFAAVMRRRSLFIGMIAGFVLLVGIITVLTPKSYTATVTLIAGNPSAETHSADTALPVLNALVLNNGEQTAETLATLAQQQGLAASVQHKLNLPITPEALLTRVAVKPVTNTSILNLSVTWRDPHTAANVANAFGDAFIERERGFVQAQAVAALTFLSQELPRAQVRMRKTSAALADYQARNGFIDAGNHTEDVVRRAAGLDAKIDGTQLDKREAEALLSNVQKQLASLPSSINAAQQISVNPVVSDLRSKLEAVDTQLHQAEQQYTNRHPAVIALRKQHQDILEQIARQPAQINSQNTLSPNPVYQSLQQQAAQYKQRLEGDQAQIELLQRERRDISPVLRSLPQESMAFATLQQQAKLASDVYNALEQKYSDAAIAKSTAISDISIIQPAVASSALVRPNLRINLLAALAAGLLLACIAIVIIDALERRVRSGIGDARVLELPLIARIPAFAPVRRSMLPWVQSMTVEAFLHLCVSLRLKTRRPLRSLAISSPCRGDGKSTIAFNLAKAMSTLEPHVLLVDADMRVPTLHAQAGYVNEVGLVDVLSGNRRLSECVQQISPNLDLLPAGVGAHNPVSLLQGSAFHDLLQSANQEYGMVIVDTPALVSVTDALLITARVDGTVIVVAENRTDEAIARRIIAEFSAIGLKNVLGIVLNMDTSKVGDYSDYFAESVRGRTLPGTAP